MRLIDADALERVLNKFVEYDDDAQQEIDADFVFIAIDSAPTIDAAPVVRCKNCKHYQIDVLFKRNYCCGRLRKPDDYCSYGEQKEDKQ